VATLGARCYGVIVVIATIIAHGALITSVGLAMAVWIKRQSRAIAMSVGSFLLVAAGWPFVVSSPTYSELRRNLASLSPVVMCVVFVNFFTIRTYNFSGHVLSSGTFWAVEVFALAMGLLWLWSRRNRVARRGKSLPLRPRASPPGTSSWVGGGSHSAWSCC
jgi:hypothetical protein